MKVLVFGEIGQLGQELIRAAERSGGALTLEVRGLEEADFTNPETCVAWVEATDADAVINAVAYTAVDKAEEDEALALKINATTPGLLAEAAAKRGLPFIHVSTDYVYDGTGEAFWRPQDATAPINAYGRTKLAGDLAVVAAGGAYAVLRTSWVVSAHGNNFIKTMLRLGAARPSINVVMDQMGAPTSARSIAAVCLKMAQDLRADAAKAGIYHFQSLPVTSWADFAREIFAQSGLPCDVQDIPTTSYPTPAPRPLNSRLDCSSLTETFGVSQPDWRADLKDILTDLETS